MSYFKSDKNKTILILVSMALLGIMIQGWFINYIDFIGVQDTYFLTASREMFSSDVLTEAEKESMKIVKDLNIDIIYPAISGFIYFIVGDIEVAFKLCYVIFSSVLIISIFLISLRLYDRRTAVISSLLIIFLPAVSITIYTAMRHVIFISLLFLSLYFILEASLRKRNLYYCLGGISLGFAYLTRGEGIVIFFSIFVIFILKSYFEKKKETREILNGSIIFLVSFLFLFIPHKIFINYTSGSWGIGGDTKYQYYTFVGGQGFVDKIKASEVVEYGLQIYGSGEENDYSILNAIKKKPTAYLSRVIKNAKDLLTVLPTPTVLPFFLLPFIGLSLIELISNYKTMELHLIFIAIVTAFIIMIVFVFNVIPRYLTPIVPIMIIWSAYGINKTQDILRAKSFHKFAYLPSIIIILSLSIMFFAYTKTIAAALPRETKAIGEWIKSNTSASDLVIVSKEWFDERFYLQYYSKRKVRNHSSVSEGSILMLRQGQGRELPAIKVNFIDSDNEKETEAVIDSYVKDLIPTELQSFKMKDHQIVIYEML